MNEKKKTVAHRFEKLDVDDALRAIIEGTASSTGKPFYESLVENLSKTLNTSGAWVTEYCTRPIGFDR